MLLAKFIATKNLHQTSATTGKRTRALLYGSIGKVVKGTALPDKLGSQPARGFFKVKYVLCTLNSQQRSRMGDNLEGPSGNDSKVKPGFRRR